jgi:serpin B
MRCLILIALCVAVASADYFNRNRFQNLLNRYQNRYDRYDQNQNLYGSDDVDDYIDDYVEQIRRERLFDRDQCPRGMEDILGFDLEDQEGDWNEYDQDIQGRRRGQRDWTDREDTFGRRHHLGRGDWSDMEDLQEGGMFQDDMDDFQGRLGGIRGGLEDVRGLYDDDQEETGSTRMLLKEVHDANTKLASRLYKQSRDEKDDKNTVVSPLSVQLALAALNYGARGNTKRQIAHVIAGNLKKHERRQVFRKLIRHLKGFRQNEYSSQHHTTQIKPVTGIFISQQTRGQQQFVQMIKNNLGATVKHCSFHQQPQQCRQMINRWMTEKTQGQLRQIVPQDAITDNTKMILVNGMKLKATWGQQMRQHVTKEAKFYPLDSKKVKIVEVLETKGRFKYHEDELVKIVGVPTEQKELTLYVIVPKDKDGLTQVEKLHLQDNVQLKQLLEHTDRKVRQVGVQLPKFQIKHKIDVRRTLRKQGVTDAFDPLRADFSGITGIPKYQQDEMEDNYNTYNDFEQTHSFRRNQLWGGEEEMMGQWQTGIHDTKLHLNKFIHQSTIKITENGITATSGSGNQMDDYEEHRRTRYGRMGGLESEELNMFDEITGFNMRQTGEKKIVKANRAFAFVVKHNPTNQLVFVGRVIDAAQKKINNIPQTINVVDQY